MKTKFFIIMLLGIPLLGLGQEVIPKDKKVSQLSFSLLTESIAFPFSRYLPIHPGAELGITIRETQREHSLSQWDVVAGGYYHEKLETGFYLKGQYHYQKYLFTHLGVDFTGSIGYMHTFYPADIYKHNPETGEYLVANQMGRPHAIAEAGIGLTYRNSSPIEPFIRQSFMLETPFANGIPVIPHSFLKFGVDIKL